jgi:hypothetical protein
MATGPDSAFTPALKSKKPSRRLGFLLKLGGAGKRNRTPDLRITNALLYRLSYSGVTSEKKDYRKVPRRMQALSSSFYFLASW